MNYYLTGFKIVEYFYKVIKKKIVDYYIETVLKTKYN